MYLCINPQKLYRTQQVYEGSDEVTGLGCLRDPNCHLPREQQRACILGLRRGYLIDLLISEPNQGSLDIDCQKAVTAVCSSIIFLCSSSIMTSRHHTSAGTAPHLSFVKSICEVQLGISADTSEEYVS
ncbi:hypothetical protein MTR67_031247 [Solanum verrucosum]|uniref:Uncharacterized protein n=1 Tax=Solanum verrucosum TaxID=315347 RepID=A0AAF0ZEN7_SOLVR|nr:hypothetical protein MTR67_031247 [Solanum verrucosum]